MFDYVIGCADGVQMDCSLMTLNSAWNLTSPPLSAERICDNGKFAQMRQSSTENAVRSIHWPVISKTLGERLVDRQRQQPFVDAFHIFTFQHFAAPHLCFHFNAPCPMPHGLRTRLSGRTATHARGHQVLPHSRSDGDTGCVRTSYETIN